MLIGIDGNEANVEKKVGIGEYSFELLRQFEEYQISNIKYQIYLKKQPREDLPKEKEGWRYRVVGPSKLWTQIALPFDLFFHRPRPDVFFSLTHYAPRFSPVPTVISVMDLSFLHFPALFKKSDLYQLKNWTAYSVKNARKVLTISQASKDDIIKYYQVEPEKVVVTYPGIKLKTPAFAKAASFAEVATKAESAGKQDSKLKITMQNSKLLKEKYGIGGDYILFVGTLQPRKNLVRLIKAYSILLSQDLNISLVIVGKKGWMYEEILAAPKKFDIEKKVKFLDYVPEGDLPLFYQNALCFVFPSLYEGFGLPVLEAMSYGCPVITSNVSSLPEAGGEAALYVNPESVEDIRKNLELIINNSELREKLIKKGYNQVKKFSWEKTAKETLKVLSLVSNV